MSHARSAPPRPITTSIFRVNKLEWKLIFTARIWFDHYELHLPNPCNWQWSKNSLGIRMDTHLVELCSNASTPSHFLLPNGACVKNLHVNLYSILQNRKLQHSCVNQIGIILEKNVKTHIILHSHKKLLWRCLWPCGALKFQIAFWALRPTSTKYSATAYVIKHSFPMFRSLENKEDCSF
jgi:hypothetical protein